MSNKKKIACALYGQPRFLEQGHANLTKSVAECDFDIDFYCHSYEYGTDFEKYEHSPWRKGDGKNAEIVRDVHTKISKLYNPIKLEVDAPFDGDLDDVKYSIIGKTTKKFNKRIYYNIKNCMSQFYSRSRLCKIVEEQNLDYEFIITCRYDFRKRIDCDFLHQLDDSKIYTSSCRPETSKINDNLLIMNAENFLKITNVYQNISDIMNNKLLRDKTLLNNVPFILSAEEILIINILYHYDDLGRLISTPKIPNYR
tara:strand:+ start:19654 stop:20418 length:765 start_codon:yes stop_codon:yes gene_type:complete